MAGRANGRPGRDRGRANGIAAIQSLAAADPVPRDAGAFTRLWTATAQCRRDKRMSALEELACGTNNRDVAVRLASGTVSQERR
jgi:hypothetical protein